MNTRTFLDVTPSAARLTSSLRDIGYNFPAAVADVVDNSIAAGATEVRIEVEFDGLDSLVVIADDGSGISATGINEALRFGTRRTYDAGQLGRYGLGLKTASLSQCRVLSVGSRSRGGKGIAIRQLDLDVIEEWDQWMIVIPGNSDVTRRIRNLITGGMSTVVVWDYLDRALPGRNTENGWARRRLASLAEKTERHLAMVFHRFLDTRDPSADVAIVVNGRKLQPWDPFASDEPTSAELGPQTFELASGGVLGTVTLRRHVLPSRDSFSEQVEWDRLAGPLKWNRQQGLYIYRADRLVQWGGWGGIRAIDEHTKLARASLDFGTELDSLFNINVAKMRVGLPPQLKQMLDKPVHELCLHADMAYRKTAKRFSAGGERNLSKDGAEPVAQASIALALRSAALQSGDFDALRRMASIIREQAPDLARSIGFDTL